MEKCPPECNVKLNGLDKQIKELKEMDAKQWEVFDQKFQGVEGQMLDRVKTRTLVALFGIVVTIFLAIMALTFSTLSNGQNQAVQKLENFQQQTNVQLMGLQREMVKQTVKLEEHTDHHNGPDR